MFPCNVAHDGVGLKYNFQNYIIVVFILFDLVDKEGRNRIAPTMTIKLTMEMLNDNEGHLGQLDVSVHEIGEVWEIQAKGELLVKPAGLVKVWS